MGCGLKVAQRADGALSGTLRRLDGLNQKVVGVGFAFMLPGVFANVRSALLISPSPITFK